MEPARSSTLRVEVDGAPIVTKSDRGWSRRDRIAIVVLVLVAAILSMTRLGTKELWLDEIDSWYVVSGGISDMASVVRAWDINGSTYFAALWIWTRFGDGEAWMRLPSVIATVATIPLVAALGRQLFDRRVGLTAAVLVATSGGLLPHAQEARPYAVAYMLAAASSLLFLRAVRRDVTSTWILYAAVSIGLVSVHLFGVLVVAGHATWLALTQPMRVRRGGRDPILATIAVAGVSVPLAIAIARQHTASSLDFVGDGQPWEPGSYIPIAELWAGGSRLSTLLLLVPFVLVVAAVGRSLRHRRFAEDGSKWFVVIGVVVPTVVVAVASLGPNLLLARYLIVCVPCFAVLSARGLELLPLRLGSIILGIGVLGSLNAAWTWLDGDSIDPFEALTTDLVGRADAGDQITFLDAYDRLGVLYHSRDTAPELLPTLVIEEEPVPRAWRGEVEIGDPVAAVSESRTWVVAHAYDGEIVEAHADELEEWAQRGLEPVDVTMFPNRALLEFPGSDR